MTTAIFQLEHSSQSTNLLRITGKLTTCSFQCSLVKIRIAS
jgi:hypothetical protein